MGKAEKKGKSERERKKIAASGFPRCSWNNFDVCMDEGGTIAAFSPFPDIRPSSFSRSM